MKTKSAMITIAGRPNVGKSTLTNYLVGEKIAIVSNKPQTTRNRICGIVTRGDIQFVFVDTPGYHKSRTKLGDYMVNIARESIADVDATILVVEPIASIGPQEEGLIEKIKASKSPAILCINKIDTVEKEALLEVIAVYSQAHEFAAIIPICAKTGEGLNLLADTVDAMFASNTPCDGSVLTNARQYDAIRRAFDAIERSLKGLRRGLTPDMVLIDVEEAMAAMGEVTGATVREDITARIFERFCVGK